MSSKAGTTISSHKLRNEDAVAKVRAADPHILPGKVSSPELDALRKEHTNLMDQAIANLVAVLGSRSFSRLDLYTRHMDDRFKAMQVPNQPSETPQSGVK